MSRRTTSHCAECRRLAVETDRDRSGSVVARSFPSGEVVRAGNGMSSITIHAACREAFVARINALSPLPEVRLS